MGVDPNQVHQGDCVQTLAAIGDGSVDLVFADPPFNIGYEYDQYDDRRSRREYLAWSKAWMSGVWRVLKPTGTFWLAIGDEYAAELKLIAQDQVGFTCRSWVIWYYTFGVNCAYGFSRSHTHLFHFVKDPERFTFNAENPAVRVLSARQLVYKDARANPKGRLPDNTWVLRPQDAPPGGFAPAHDTWYFARVAGTFKEREGFHGCQMPEQLLGRIIRLSSHPQELVLDPFAGSGTTLAVAKKLGRRWLGIELSREYVRRIRQRLDATRVGAPLDGPADPLRSAPATAAGKSKVRLRNGRPIPPIDGDTERGIIAAFRTACRGATADQLLCDPELNAAFASACRKKGLYGDAFVWNRLLLRIRKAGRLPHTRGFSRKLAPETMDRYGYASEIAAHLTGLDYSFTLDDVLCSPVAAAEFDGIAAEFGPSDVSPFEYRWAALAIRKRATRSRPGAKRLLSAWLTRRLPPRTPLPEFRAARYERPGVYVLADAGRRALYVGETLNMRARIDQTLTTERWAGLDVRYVTCVPTEENGARQDTLQSVLIYRTEPLLNWPFLRPDCGRPLHPPPGGLP